MSRADWLLLVIFLPPMADMAGSYWGGMFRKCGGKLAGWWKRKRRPKLFWPE